MLLQKFVIFICSLSLFATAYPAYSGTYEGKILIQDLTLQNLQGEYLGSVAVKKTVTISLTLANNQDEALSYFIVVEVRNGDDVTENIQFQSGNLASGSATVVGFSWTSEVEGAFSVRSFAVSSLQEPEILSAIYEHDLTVTDFEQVIYQESNTILFDKVDDKLSAIDAKINEAFEALGAGSYSDTNRWAFEAKALLGEAKEGLQQIKVLLQPQEVEIFDAEIQYYDGLGTLLLKTSEVLSEYNELNLEMEEAETDEELVKMLPAIKLFFRSLQELGQDWIDFSDKLDSYSKNYPELGFTIDDVQVYYDVGVSYQEAADEWDEWITIVERQYSTAEYVPLEEREIPSSEYESAYSEMITPEMAEFFDAFDANQDGEIDVGEGQEFYYWVENNIQYRYDDEEELEPLVGYVVGDGREGVDYRQKPLETLNELYGDCEDMATLEQAFYQYFGVETYSVGVNAKVESVIDHAATIIRIAEDVETFRDYLGDLVYYEFEEGDQDVYGNPIGAGAYMLVDNAYSDAYGYLSNGLEPDTFWVQCSIPLEFGYDEEWDEVKAACAVPMD
jgi:hypothetical protein